MVDAEEAKGARVIEASAGQVIALDADVRIEVLGPPPILLGAQSRTRTTHLWSCGWCMGKSAYF